MIFTEYYKTREDGVVLNRTYSDKGMMIERDGVRYSEAIDPAGSGRTYTESDTPREAQTAATEADYQADKLARISANNQANTDAALEKILNGG